MQTKLAFCLKSFINIGCPRGSSYVHSAICQFRFFWGKFVFCYGDLNTISGVYLGIISLPKP